MSRTRLLPILLPALAAQAQSPAPPAVPTPDPRAILAKATADLVKSGQAERAVHQGQAAPDFTLPDAKGRPVHLADLLKKGPVALTFYRGGWCPYCNRQLKSYQDHLAEIHALGAKLVAISPQLPDATVSTEEKDALAFPVLSDAGNRVARTYGLVFRVPDEVIPIYRKFGVDLEASNGDRSHELPMPGTYIIGQDGIIRLSYVQADYSRRLPVEDLLAGLRKVR